MIKGKWDGGNGRGNWPLRWGIAWAGAVPAVHLSTCASAWSFRRYPAPGTGSWHSCYIIPSCSKRYKTCGQTNTSIFSDMAAASPCSRRQRPSTLTNSTETSFFICSSAPREAWAQYQPCSTENIILYNAVTPKFIKFFCPFEFSPFACKFGEGWHT